MEENEIKRACRIYEARLESALEGQQDAEVAAHLEACASCRQALDLARQAQHWLTQTHEPAADPGPWFATRVMSRIREEQTKRVPSSIWAPIESFASRLAIGVGMILILLCAYVYETPRRQPVETTNGQTEVTGEFPQVPTHPADKDEVLASLSGANNGY